MISVDDIRHDVIVAERSAGHLFALKHRCCLYLAGFSRISATSYCWVTSSVWHWLTSTALVMCKSES